MVFGKVLTQIRIFWQESYLFQDCKTFPKSYTKNQIINFRNNFLILNDFLHNFLHQV